MNSKAVLVRILVLLGIVSLLFLAACGGGTAPAGNNSPSKATGVSVSPSLSGQRAETQGRAMIVTAYGKLRLAFETNRGQTDPAVKFLARGHGYSLFLTPTAAVLSLRTPADSTPPSVSGLQGQESTPAFFPKAPFMRSPTLARNQPRTHSLPLRMELVGANPAPRVIGTDELPGKSNYFIGNDPARWRTNVPTYAKVKYEEIWPGVDLVYYGNPGQLEYDFIIAPGADPKTIRISFGGLARTRDAVPLQVDRDGNLVLHTSGGELQFHKPIVYQQVGDARQEIAGRYVIRSNRQIGFEVGTYDASRPLIIDPVLSYSTYLGGSGNVTFGDVGDAIAVDGSGSAYVTGQTFSINFPTKNPLQAVYGGNGDAFVAKLDPIGSSLIYSTFLGGSGNDSGSGIAVDGSGNAYVTGSTNSANFPTKNPFQAALGGGSDAFVAKLNSTGSLIYSTYLGGSGDDSGSGITVDGSGNAYVTGQTFSINFPTASPFQPNCGACGGGQSNAFVSKLNAAGSALVYSTYLGGSSRDGGAGIAVDASGNAYVTGFTQSTNFPTKSPLQAALGGNADAFVAKLDSTGSVLVYSTYLGGSGSDIGNGIGVDASGNAYVTGQTSSANFPTVSPFQATCGSCVNGQSNAFVSKLNAAGSALVYSTYLGGSGGTGGDFGNAIAVDTSSNAYVTGLTSSLNFPLASPIQSSFVLQTCLSNYYGYTYTFPCGNTAFVTKLNPTGFPLVYSTYLGASGGNFEEGRGIAVDASGNAYVTGRATSNFPLTPGAFQTSPGGSNGDAFVAKISPNDAPGFSLAGFSLGFQDEGIGGTTAPQQITLANTGSATLTIASIVSSGDFAETNTCGSSLAGGTSCTINVTFTPTAAGARTGTITITDSVASSPQKVALSGNGIAGLAATLSPTSLSFGNQTQGTTSASQSVTLTNTGSATLNINGFLIVGTNPSDFTLLIPQPCGQGLAVGASCTFGIVFAPQAVGNRSAAFQILDNSAQSPRMVPLTGVGVAPPTVALSPTSLSFAAQVVGSISQGQSITLTTTGSGTLSIPKSGISTTNNDFFASNNCGSSVVGGGSCTITVAFTPQTSGNRTGTLVIVSNAANGTQMVSLAGLGTDFSIAPAVGSSSKTVTAGQSATYTVSAAGTSGFSGTVFLSCASSAPQSITCGVSPNSLMVSGTTAQNAAVTATTIARSALPSRWRPPILPPSLRVVLPWLLLLLSLSILIRALRQRSRRRRRAWVGLAAMLMAASLFFGCGGGGSNAPPPPPQGTPAGNYQITVTAMSAGVTRTTTLSLIVQ